MKKLMWNDKAACSISLDLLWLSISNPVISSSSLQHGLQPAPSWTLRRYSALHHSTQDNKTTKEMLQQVADVAQPHHQEDRTPGAESKHPHQGTVWAPAPHSKSPPWCFSSLCRDWPDSEPNGELLRRRRTTRTRATSSSGHRLGFIQGCFVKTEREEIGFGVGPFHAV